MADLYSQVIRGDGVSSYTVGNNTRNLQPTQETGTPRLTPIIIDDLYTAADDIADWPISQLGLAKNGPQFKVLQALQQFVTVYSIGDSRGDDKLTVICRDSSIPYDDGKTFKDVEEVITKLQTAVRAIATDDEYKYSSLTVNIGLISDDDTDNPFEEE
jgi:hypothetical protein